ncbi:hypothetical protein L13192_01373 [Pyrenophora tritici-repentis]|nr:hypothetical protein L13192_01373 [Pyrenophora tritici-repentis]KAI1688250.1 hypothetical protein KJE20_01427 [Pyrenophora tritici-repentis]
MVEQRDDQHNPTSASILEMRYPTTMALEARDVETLPGWGGIALPDPR